MFIMMYVRKVPEGGGRDGLVQAQVGNCTRAVPGVGTAYSKTVVHISEELGSSDELPEVVLCEGYIKSSCPKIVKYLAKIRT